MGAKGWHSRGYLPHYDGYDITQHVVFRLHDAVPPNSRDGDDVLDQHLGSSYMRDHALAHIVAETLLHTDGEHHHLRAWCVMPNHVHVLLSTGVSQTIGATIRRWKTFSAKRMNLHLGRTGAVWARDYFDRYMRDETQFQTAKSYIEMNPVTAGLCDTPEDWPFGSAGWNRRTPK